MSKICLSSSIKDNITKVPCENPETLRSNLIYLAFQTVEAITPKDWLDDLIVYEFMTSSVPKGLEHEMSQLFNTVGKFNGKARDVIQNATNIFLTIYDNVHSDRETVRLVALNLDNFKDVNYLSIASGIVDEIEQGIHLFVKPINDSIEEFNNIMTNNQLEKIIDDIQYITNKCKKDDPKISILRKKILNLNKLLKFEIEEIPNRYETAKIGLEKCVAEYIKPIENPENPDDKSCAEENYLKNKLYKPFNEIITSLQH